MSAPLGPGDWVEFRPQHEFPPEHIQLSGLTVGAIYQVLNVFLAGGKGALDLVGVPPYRTSEHRGFSVRAFRPIYRPKQSIIEALKHPAPEREREDA